MASAVRLYAPEHPSLALTVRAKLERLRAEKLANIIHAQDWTDFQRRVGEHNALGAAIDLCAKTESELNQG